MKKILALSFAFLILAILPQMATAQEISSKEAVKMEKKESKKEAKKIKKEQKKAKKEAKKMTDSETQVQDATPETGIKEEQVTSEEGEAKAKKNEPRPYVSKKIEQPKKEPKTQHKVSKAEDQ